MMRSTVFDASMVCSVENTRWPVSAAVSAISIVSRSRISPTRITFGACRSAARSAARKRRRVAVQLALVHRALLVVVQELDRVFDGEDVLGAGLVDQVDHRRQRRRLARAGRAGDQHDAVLERGDLGEDGGRLSSASVGILVAITRITIAYVPRWRKTLTRKRARSRSEYDRSHAPCSLSVAKRLLVVRRSRSRAIPAVCSARSFRARRSARASARHAARPAADDRARRRGR